MSAIILHHYPLSPYSEKARLAMGLKGLSWNSVEIPVWTPRPKLTPMTGGYRRTPILQIGAEFYCDTLLILAGAGQAGDYRQPVSEPSGGPGQGIRLVDREGLVHECRVPDARQPRRQAAAGADRRAPPLLRREHRPGRSAAQARHVSATLQCAHRVAGGSAGRRPQVSSSARTRRRRTCRPTTRSGSRARTVARRSRSCCRSRASSVLGTTASSAIGHGKPVETTPDQAIEAARSG